MRYLNRVQEEDQKPEIAYVIRPSCAVSTRTIRRKIEVTDAVCCIRADDAGIGAEARPSGSRSVRENVHGR